MIKKLFVSLTLATLVLSACGRPNAFPPNQPLGYGGTPGYSQQPLNQGIGTGYGDPYGSGYSTVPSNPSGSYYGSDPYSTSNCTGYGNTSSYGTPYTNTGNYADPYANTGSYGTPYANTGSYGTGYNANCGGAVDPVTGQPYGPNSMINPALDRGVSTQLVNKIQQAGGYKGMKADNVVRDELKKLGVSIQEAFQNSPPDHRALIVKTLLDGWAGKEDETYARQVWNTLPPMEQQRLLSQDSVLSDLVRKKMDGSGSSSSSPLSFLSGLLGKKK